MTDPWWWAAIGGGVGAGTVIREVARLVMRAATARTGARKTDAEVSAELRDALVVEIGRLRARVDQLDIDLDTMRTQLHDCEARSAESAAENEKLREHADALAGRVSQLEATR